MSRTTTLALLLCLLPLSAAGEVYKWIDDDGTVHYGQKPPAGQQAETVKPQSSVDTEAARESFRQRQEELQSRDEQRAEKKKTEAEEEKKAAARKERCQAAKRALEQMQTQNRIQYINDEGERAYMSEEQRQEREKQAREMKEKHCQS